MKKNILNTFLFLSITFFIINTSTVQAQSATEITMSVKDIRYDDPNFTALRESLKKNPKVKLVKPSYSSGVAILSFMYAGEASQLWEEIPKTFKRFFNLDELGDNAISITYVTPNQNAGKSTVATNPMQNKTNKKDCFDCDYFPLCTFDDIKKYGGKPFHGIRQNDNSIVYYYCEDGVLIKRWEYTSTVSKQQVISDGLDNLVISYDDYVNGTATLTIMKSNVPVGYFWESKESEISTHYGFTLAGKGIKVTKDGKTYSDVIKIKTVRPHYKPNYYFYGKNVGYLGENLQDNQLVSLNEAWGGTWKLIEDNGRAVPQEASKIIILDDDGRIRSFRYFKGSRGELFRAFSSDIDGSPTEWFAGNQMEGVFYPVFTYGYGWGLSSLGSDKITSANKASIPKKTLTIDSKTYQFLGKNYNLQNEVIAPAKNPEKN